MQMLTIVCDVSLEERVLAGLREINVPGYTRLTDLTGAGRTGRRDGDPIWPGTNSLLLVVVPDEEVQPVVDMLHHLKSEYSRPPALRVFTVPA
ncbi:MAG: hypothetical protein M3Y56_00810, partial [Armatimonadota bacterium]|nr:hypothetical protein [Armatimonadota bacterium]